MADNHDRRFLDLQIKQTKLMEYALEECIKQFDYSADPKWQANFKQMMINLAKNRMILEEGG